MRTVTWRTIWEDNAEPGEVRRVLSALSNSMGGNGGQNPTNCSPSMHRLARRAGMRRDSTNKWIKVAEEQGWINVGRLRGMRNRYYATLPEEHRHFLDGDEEPSETTSPAVRLGSLEPVEGSPGEAGCPQCHSVMDRTIWQEKGSCGYCGYELLT